MSGFCATIVLSCFIIAYTPPHEYDYEPITPYTITVLPEPMVLKECQRQPHEKLWGCTVHEYPVQRVIIDDRLSGGPLQIVLRHEKAHVNGWRH